MKRNVLDELVATLKPHNCPNGADHDWLCSTEEDRIRLSAIDMAREERRAYDRLVEIEEEES